MFDFIYFCEHDAYTNFVVVIKRLYEFVDVFLIIVILGCVVLG